MKKKIKRGINRIVKLTIFGWFLFSVGRAYEQERARLIAQREKEKDSQ